MSLDQSSAAATVTKTAQQFTVSIIEADFHELGSIAHADAHVQSHTAFAPGLVVRKDLFL
ncbi:MAG: hypothetical protein U1E77_19785 [Inhella sp.]